MKTFKFALREDLKNDKRFLPTRATSKSAGWDVSCAFEDHKSLIVQPKEWIKVPLGFRYIPPQGYWCQMVPRSSTFTKKQILALYGTIDCDYRGYWYFCGKYEGDKPLTLEFGERIGQLIIVKLQKMEVEEISNKEYDDNCKSEDNQRKGGFGSSGDK